MLVTTSRDPQKGSSWNLPEILSLRTSANPSGKLTVRKPSLWSGYRIDCALFAKSEELAENVPRALDAIADIVLAYKPKPKSKPGKKRQRRGHENRVTETVRGA